MNRYYIFKDADKEKPGSGFVEQIFEGSDDKDAMELARRHYEGTGMTVWAHNGTNHNAHIQFRFVDYIDGPPKEKKRGPSQPAG